MDLEDLGTTEPEEPTVHVQVSCEGRVFHFERDEVTLDIHGPELAVRNKRTKDLLLRCYGSWFHRNVTLDEDGDEYEHEA